MSPEAVLDSVNAVGAPCDFVRARRVSATPEFRVRPLNPKALLVLLEDGGNGKVAEEEGRAHRGADAGSDSHAGADPADGLDLWAARVWVSASD